MCLIRLGSHGGKSRLPSVVQRRKAVVVFTMIRSVTQSAHRSSTLGVGNAFFYLSS